MTQAIQPGDIVTLHSGGMRMTVEGTSPGAGTANVAWFDDHDNFFQHVVGVASLKLLGRNKTTPSKSAAKVTSKTAKKKS